MNETNNNYTRARSLRSFFYLLVKIKDWSNQEKHNIVKELCTECIECGECRDHAMRFLSEHKISNINSVYQFWLAARDHALENKNNTGDNEYMNYDQFKSHHNKILKSPKKKEVIDNVIKMLHLSDNQLLIDVIDARFPSEYARVTDTGTILARYPELY